MKAYVSQFLVNAILNADSSLDLRDWQEAWERRVCTASEFEQLQSLRKQPRTDNGGPQARLLLALEARNKMRTRLASMGSSRRNPKLN